MDFRGISFIAEGVDFQAEIDALDARVTTLETKMTTVESKVAVLESGVFAGRVFAYADRPSPFMIAQATTDVTFANDEVGFDFVTPGANLFTYYDPTSIFHFFTCGVMNGSGAGLEFILANNLVQFGGSLFLSVGTETTHYVHVDAYLQIYNYVSSTSAECKVFIRGYVSQSASVAPPLQADCVETHSISINPSTDLTMALRKRDTTAFTTYTRTQGWVECLS
jgi:hypothetical protein